MSSGTMAEPREECDEEVELELPSFFYLDDDKRRQGPFTATQLRAWSGALGADRLVARAPYGMPRPLSSWPGMYEPEAAEGQPEAECSPGSVDRSPGEPEPSRQPLEEAARREPGDVNGDEPVLLAAEAEVMEHLPAAAAVEYEYLDDQGVVRGPFSAEQIGKWLTSRLLLPSRRARAVPSQVFAAIASLPDLSRFCAKADLDRALHAAAVAPQSDSVPAGGGGAPSAYSYLDAAGQEQGPFGAGLVRAWVAAGALPPTTAVRAQGDLSYGPLGMRAELRALLPAGAQLESTHAVGAPQLSAEEQRLEENLSRVDGAQPPGTAYRPAAWTAGAAALRHSPPRGAREEGAGAGAVDYVARGSFNARTGRFVAADGAGADAHWERRGLPADRAGRQLANYFSHDEWQSSQQAGEAGRPDASAALSKRVRRA